MGTKKGYLWAIFVWSLGACLHAACGIATCWFVKDVSSVEALRAVQAGSATVQSLSREDLEKEMATHSRTLAWKIPRTKEHIRLLQFKGSQRVGHD